MLARTWLTLLLACAMLAGLSGSAAWRRELAHDAYVWQRAWTPDVIAAVASSAELVRSWRVLAMHSDRYGRLQPVAVDWSTLAASNRPSIAVVRIQGQLPQLDETRLLAEIELQLDRWRGAGIAIAGLEIDHDCGTARLAGYGRFLAALRNRLRDRGLPLSITALPAWLGAPAFDAVTATVDEVVLQVHAVRDPRGGLFDAAAAERWIADLAVRGGKPFRVALPNYGVRLALDEGEAVLAVRAERPLLVAFDSSRELMAAPAEVAALLRRLERLRGIAGIAWFRLPTVGDARAWSPATWRAVIRDAPLANEVTASLRPGHLPGLGQVVLANAGAIDAALPRGVALPERCRLADGIGGYGLAETGSGLLLERREGGWLPGGRERVIGWARCGEGEVVLAVRP